MRERRDVLGARDQGRDRRGPRFAAATAEDHQRRDTWPNWPTPARTSTRQRALEIGLVNAVYGNADEVLAGARALALEIAQNSPLAVQGTKAVLAANDGRSVDEGLEFVARWNTMYLQSNDLREAMTAFMEKRPPVFNGD